MWVLTRTWIWMELTWNLNWIWIELNWIELSWIECLYWTEQKWTKASWHGIVVNLIWVWIELIWVSRLESGRFELSCFEIVFDRLGSFSHVWERVGTFPTAWQLAIATNLSHANAWAACGSPPPTLICWWAGAPLWPQSQSFATRVRKWRDGGQSQPFRTRAPGCCYRDSGGV